MSSILTIDLEQGGGAMHGFDVPKAYNYKDMIEQTNQTNNGAIVTSGVGWGLFYDWWSKHARMGPHLPNQQPSLCLCLSVCACVAVHHSPTGRNKLKLFVYISWPIPIRCTLCSAFAASAAFVGRSWWKVCSSIAATTSPLLSSIVVGIYPWRLIFFFIIRKNYVHIIYFVVSCYMTKNTLNMIYILCSCVRFLNKTNI